MRSAMASSPLPATPEPRWQVELPGKLTAPIVANGKVLKLDYRYTLLDFETIVKEVQLLSEMLAEYMVAAKKITGTGAHKIEER